MRWTRTRVLTLAGIVAVVLLFAVLAWRRRWISDDGLIFVRVVRNILAGNGPVYNDLERVEANTSALWPWLVALVGGVSRANLSHVAVATGLVCSVGGVALAMDGSRRWLRARGSTAILVPAGILIPIAVFPFWDYATSGLETGLTTLWLGTIWWCLVQLPRRDVLAAVMFGLGPLVRPDLAVASMTFLVAGWFLIRPTRKRTFQLLLAAAALPVAYEIFRAGYYGTLVPLPALAKSATHSQWGRGFEYLHGFLVPFALWLPFGALAVLLVVVARRRGVTRPDWIVIAAPIAASTVMALYILRVGGDFMFGRMWLPATFLALLPGALLPLRKISVIAIVAVALWCGYMAIELGQRHIRRISKNVHDERIGYVEFTNDKHPVDEVPYRHALPVLETAMTEALAHGHRLLLTEGGVAWPLDPAFARPVVFVAGRLGLGGVLAPLDGFVADTLGLSNPIGARIEMNAPEEGAGHQKILPWSWLLGDFADPARMAETDVSPMTAAAARHAMTCGDLKELLDSVREPLTVGRFFSNLTGAIGRTRLAIPSDAVLAEMKFCGSSLIPLVTASSSCEDWGWGRENLVDGRTDTVIGKPLGYSSTVHAPSDHAEWIEIAYPEPQRISKVRIYPRSDPGFVGVGFPIDFTISTWDGHAWVEQHRETGYPLPAGPQELALTTPVTTSKLRIEATHLQNGKVDGYALELAELELVH
ncbi:MAG: discoidin domain-containing protein [Kofleriaceae bacterium]